MATRNHSLRPGHESSRNHNRLALEQLEARLAFAIDGIESNLQILAAPSVGNAPVVANTAPSIVNLPRLNNGSEVRTRSVTASVLGADDQGESNLRYTWQVASQPAPNSVAFAANATNAAKNNTLTFTRAGNYSVNVNVRDNAGATSTRSLQFKVVSTLSQLQVRATDNRILNSNATIQTNENNVRFRVQGLDQFNATLSSLPPIAWQRVSGPSGGTATFQSEAGGTKVTFNRAGLYLLRVQSGSQSFDVSVNVAQVLRSLQLTTPNGTAVTANQKLIVTEASQRINVRGLDQFNQPMTSLPSITWISSSVPTGGRLTSSFTSGVATLNFNRLGVYQIRAVAGAAAINFTAEVTPSLASIRATTVSNRLLSATGAVGLSASSAPLTAVGLDQFGAVLSRQPAITWQSTTKPADANVTLTTNANVATANFSRAGIYGFRATSGSRSLNVSINVTQTLTRLAPVNPDGTTMGANSAINVTSSGQSLNVRGLDQFGNAMLATPKVTWTIVSQPATGAGSIVTDNGDARAVFTRAGRYMFRAASDNLTVDLSFNVVQTLTKINVTPGTSRLAYQTTQLFQASALDQFDKSMAVTPTFTWSATGGSIASTGSYVSGAGDGNFSVRAQVGTIVGSAAITIAASTPPVPQNSLSDEAIASLVQSFYADGRIDREDMIQVLRSAEDGGTVDANELADFRYLVSLDSSYVMPEYVRALATDIVTDNPANLKFKGQTAGNLVAGSPATLLNNLVSKWFLGADQPALTSSSLSYQNAVGSLFVNAPSRADAKQGMLGDCYFIASLVAIADRNPEAVRNLFIDNGDNTFTVRFFGGTLGYFYTDGGYTAGFASGSGVADYVTVDRKLPAYSNGMLAYSGYGQSVASATTSLWIALAEKAYAQWNETRNAGRDGVNQYSSIEGGWMSNVNAQVLGYNSTNYAFSSTPKQTLVNALAAGRAVTLGTKTSPGDGFVGGHAYVITGYNAGTDRFSVYNPWGNTHPAPVTWAQLQANCSLFVVTDTAGTRAINATQVRGSVDTQLIGNWTEVIARGELASHEENDGVTTGGVFAECDAENLNADSFAIQESSADANDQSSIAFALATATHSVSESMPLSEPLVNLEALDLVMASLFSKSV